MKNLLIIFVLAFGMMACGKEDKTSKWKVEISSPDNIYEVQIACDEYIYQDDAMTTTYVVKEFTNPTVGGVGVKAWGNGIITIKAWKDGELKEVSGVGVGSGLILNY